MTLMRFALLFCLTSVLLSLAWAAPTPADKLFETASQFMRIGNDKQAVTEFQQFVLTHPDDTRIARAYFLLGFSNQKLQQYDKALEAYTRALGKAAGDDFIELRATTHFQMAECSRALKDYEKAAQSYGNFLTLSGKVNLDGKDAEFSKTWKNYIVVAQYQRAGSLYQLNRPEEALREYEKLLTIAPTDPLSAWACYRIGVMHLNASRFTEAINALERVTTDFNGSEVTGEATSTLGFAYLWRARGQNDAAARQRDYQRAAEILTTIVGSETVTTATKQQAALALAEAYYALNDPEKTLASYNRALDFIDPASRQGMEIRVQRAHVLYNAKRYADAAQEYGKIAESKNYPELANEAQYWFATATYQQATTTKETQGYRLVIDALTHFLTPPGEKDAKAPQAALLIAYSYEDLANAGEQDARDKATAAFTRVLQQWPGSDQAVQARAGINRLTRSMAPEQLQALAGTLPAGAVSWDVALQLAHKEFTARRYEEALIAARKALGGKPTGEILAQASYLTAGSLHKLGRPQEAVPYYQQVLTATPFGKLAPYAQRGLVQVYLDLQQYPQARDAALALVKMPALGKDGAELDAEQAERLMYLAAAYVQNQQHAESQATYRRIVTEHANSTLVPQALMNIAWIAETQKEYVTAADSYRDFIAKFPDHELVPEAFFQLGLALVKVQEYEKAVAAFQSVPESHKLADQAAYAIALAYSEQKITDKATAQYLLITEKFPKSPLAADCWYRLGEAKLAEKNYADAMRYFSRALDLCEEKELSALIAYQLGVSAFQAEEYAMASNAFGKVTANSPDSPHASDSLFWRAQALEKQGAAQATVAREAYAQYVAKYPTGEYAADAAVGVARAALTAKLFATTRTDAQQAFSVCAQAEKSGNAKLIERAKTLGGEIQYTLAQSYFEEKNYQQALKEFAGVSIYKYEPWYSRAYLQMARCSALLGDKDNAVNTLRLLLHITPDSDAAKQAPEVAKELGLQL